MKQYKLKPDVKLGSKEMSDISFDEIDQFFENLNVDFKIPDSAVKYKSGKQDTTIQIVDLNNKKTGKEKTLF